ncbi:MAG: DUF975 family protein [Vagococcus sp.]|uniref:DUF975 family protein n=1 Tax=Vagococcus sp. TaxID=1933889 RepID=UPI002FCBFB16
MSEMKFCPNCGNELKPETKFCGKCGYNVLNDEKESFSEKMKTSFDKIQKDEPFELNLETAEGLDVSRTDLKFEAQKKLSGRYGEWLKSIIWYLVAVVVITFISMIATGKMSYVDYASYYYGYSTVSGFSRLFWFIIWVVAVVGLFLIVVLFNAVLQWMAIYSLKGKEANGVKIFEYLVKAQKNRVLKANVLMNIYIFFWSLLFIIPGIVKQASYGMTNILLEKEPELSASDAINLSRQIMKGYKLEFLILRYSFFFWNLVSGLTFGLASFYVLPYQYTTEVLFLENLYEKYLEKTTEEIK